MTAECHCSRVSVRRVNRAYNRPRFPLRTANRLQALWARRRSWTRPRCRSASSFARGRCWRRCRRRCRRPRYRGCCCWCRSSCGCCCCRRCGCRRRRWRRRLGCWRCGQARQLRNTCVEQERLGSGDGIDCVEISSRRAAIEVTIGTKHDIRDHGFHRSNRCHYTGNLINQIKIFQATRGIPARTI